MHKATIHDSHQQIRTQTPQNRMNKPRMKKLTKIAQERHEKSNELQTWNRRNHESFHSLGGQILYRGKIEPYGARK
jgi:hypothetical protein